MLSISGTGVAAENDYRVVIDEHRPREAKVQVQLEPADQKICLRSGAADTGLTHGWATFIHRLNVTRATDGTRVTARYDGDNCWRLDFDQAVNVEYRMLLQHDRFPNMPGDDELAYAGDWGQFWTGRALFMQGQDNGPVTVEFELPEGWRATAPWAASDPGQLHFRPQSTSALLDSGFMLGTHQVLQNTPDTDNIIIATAGAGPAALAPEVLQLARQAWQEFAQLHQAHPDGRLAIFLGEGRHAGGGVLGSTISMLISGEVTDQIRAVLAYIVVHEVFHLWNANLNYADLRRAYWFSEGFAEFFAFQYLLNAGVWDQNTFDAQMAERHEKYRAALSGSSMAEAGTDKLNHYDLIYSGGLVAAAALDAKIKSHGHASGLASIMAPLYAQYSSPDGVAFSNDGLASLILELTGTDVSEFIRNSIQGTALIPPPGSVGVMNR